MLKATCVTRCECAHEVTAAELHVLHRKAYGMYTVNHDDAEPLFGQMGNVANTHNSSTFPPHWS